MIGRLLFNIFLLPFFCVASYFFIKDKKLILLGSGLGYKFIGNTKYFYLWLIHEKKRDFTFFWITRNKKIFNDLYSKKYPVLYLYSVKGFWYILRAKLLIIEQSGQDIAGTSFLLGRFSIFDCFHGIALKDASLSALWKQPTFYNKVMKFLGEKEQHSYIGYLATSIENAKTAIRTLSMNPNVQILGYPRNDIFFDLKLRFYRYENLLQLNKYKKVFLYAPTFRDNGIRKDPFSDNLLQKLNEFLTKTNGVLFLKVHPLSGDVLKSKNYSHIKNISSIIEDTQELLPFVDVLITDYSSIFMDFVLTGRPVIFYCFDYKDYVKNSRNLYYNYFSEMLGPFAKDGAGLLAFIKTVHIWSKQKQYKIKYKKFVERFQSFRRGGSSERLYQYILSAIN